MRSMVSVLAALLAMFVPASASPFEPNLWQLRESLARIADEVY